MPAALNHKHQESSYKIVPPIAIFIYNRPEKCKKLMQAMRTCKPTTLFIIADGPSKNKPEDSSLCALCREITTDVDWPCSVHKLFREENLGSRKSVSEGLKWVFSKVDSAIILEDDCIPSQSFIYFAGEMLSRYQYDEKIMLVSGRRIDQADSMTGDSYYFSRYCLTHGWATWSRFVHAIDWEMEAWADLRKTNWLLDVFSNKHYVSYWTWIFDRMINGMDAWDYALNFHMFRLNGLCIIPSVNMIENIGFDAEGTNTLMPHKGISDRKAVDICFPLQHPEKIERDVDADDRIEWMIHSGFLYRQMEYAKNRMINTRNKDKNE